MINLRPVLATHRLLAWKVLLFGAIVLFAPHRGWAQTRLVLPDFSDLFVPDFTITQHRLFSERLQVESEHQVIMETLLSDYESEFSDGVMALRHRISEHHPLPDDVSALDEQMRAEFREQLQRKLDQYQEAQSNGEGPERLLELKADLEKLQKRTRDELFAIRPKPLMPDQVRDIGALIIMELQGWRQQRQQIRERFVAGLMATLNDHQRRRWPELERLIRRRYESADTRLSGESVDLSLLLDQLDLSVETRVDITSVRMAYETELDALLQMKRVFLQESRFELFQVMITGDRVRGLSIFDQELEIRGRIQAVNARYSVLFAQALPEDVGSELSARYREIGFPRIHRPTRIRQLYADSERLADLPNGLAGDLDELRAEYDEAFEQLSDRIQRVSVETETILIRLRMAHRSGIGSIDDTQADAALEQVQSAFQIRSDLDAQYLEKLRNLLGETIFKSLNP